MAINSRKNFIKIQCELKFVFIINILILSLSRAETEIEYLIIPEGGDWQLIEEGWPTVGSNQFIYIKNTNEEISWKLNESYLYGFDDEQVFRLKFKYWIHEKNPKKGRVSSYITFDEKDENVVSLRDRYFNDIYKDNWMPFEFMFSNKDSDLIKITTKLGSNNDLVAFKDIIIEQELNQLKDKTFNSWKHFGPEFQQMLDQKEYIYYFINDDCSKGCNITLDSTVMENIASITFWKVVENAKISFEPNLTSGNSYPTNVKLSDKLSWDQFESEIDVKSLKIIVKTKELNDLTQKSFVAIKSLKVGWRDSASIIVNGGPNEIKFPFIFNPKAWLVSEFPTINETKEFYFTNKSFSTIELLVEENFLEKDYCLSFEYMTKTPETELIFSYNLNDDEFKQVFFISTPLTSEKFLRHETLCLSNLIALDIKNGLMKIFITVKFNDENISDEENKFYLKSLKLHKETDDRKISFSKLWGYLSDFNLEGWKNQWNPTKESHFSLNQSHIEFNDENVDKTLKSAELSSDWIVYDINNRENFKINGKLIVWLDDRNALNSFILTAKVCNSISKCQWLSLKSDESNETHTYYDFNFNGFIITEDKPELIRLVLNLKYGFTNGNQLKVNLKLLNFGNPCFGYKYCQLELNTEKRNPKPIFKCPQGTSGIECDKINYCSQRYNITDIKNNRHINMSGDRIYNDFNGEAKCLQDGNGFRCECEKLNNGLKGGLEQMTGPIYNREKYICEQPKYKFTAWSESQPIRPIDEQNNFEISFENLKTDGNDICIKIYYKAQGVTYIRALYNLEDLFEVSLDINNNEFEFCLLDFRTTIGNKFSVNIKFRNNLKIFEYKNFASYGKNAKQSNLYKVYSELGKFDDWTALPSSIWDINNVHATMKVKGNETIKALITSRWIDSDEDFNNYKNHFNYQFYQKELINTFKFEQSIRDKDNRKLFQQQFTNGKIDHSNNGTIKYKTGSTTPFRILFEIENIVTSNAEFSLTISDLVFGNACIMENGRATCPNNQKCTIKTFGNFKCECDGLCESNCSKLKSSHNETNLNKYCTNSATLPYVFNGCYDNGNSYKCDCPNSDFVWSINKTDNMLGTCKRNPENKPISVKCSSSGCKFLQINNTQWSNSVMPKVTKDLLPFHYATKSGGKLWLKVNVNSSQEACFRFRYWASTNSSIRTLYKGTLGLNLGQTFISTGQNWFPELKNEAHRVCTSDILNYDSYNYLIGFENTNIVALKFEKLPEINNLTTKQSLPYLTIINKNSDVNKQWSLLHPKINPESLRISSDNPNEILFKGWGEGNITRKSYLISNIIKNDRKYKRIGFNISKIISSKDLCIKVVLLDKKLEIIETVVSIMDSNLTVESNTNGKIFSYNKLNFTNVSTEFRLGFIIEFSNSSTSFSITNVNVNDPCITGENIINTCNNNGICQRIVKSDSNQTKLCGNWTEFGAQKCIHIIDKEKLINYENAIQMCAQTEKSHLITIISEIEQIFIEKYLKDKQIVDNVWIGLKNENGFKWSDKSSVDYTNWADKSPINEIDLNCVQISSEPNMRGQWINENCIKKAVVICQTTHDKSLLTITGVCKQYLK